MNQKPTSEERSIWGRTDKREGKERRKKKKSAVDAAHKFHSEEHHRPGSHNPSSTPPPLTLLLTWSIPELRFPYAPTSHTHTHTLKSQLAQPPFTLYPCQQSKQWGQNLDQYHMILFSHSFCPCLLNLQLIEGFCWGADWITIRKELLRGETILPVNSLLIMKTSMKFVRICMHDGQSIFLTFKLMLSGVSRNGVEPDDTEPWMSSRDDPSLNWSNKSNPCSRLIW